MNREDIIRMAKDCGINFHQAGWPELERFAALVAAAEREACAKAAERFEPDEKTDYVTYASQAIRARGNK